jgi:hypothetical protein
MCKRCRIASSVRLCLSAISVTLFPASTNSRNCLSSSGPHGRLALRAPLIIRPAISLCAGSSDKRLHDVVPIEHRSQTFHSQLPVAWSALKVFSRRRLTIHKSKQLYRTAIQSRERQIRSRAGCAPLLTSEAAYSLPLASVSPGGPDTSGHFLHHMKSLD